ncbi:MAG: DUF86 domain-containing protein [Phycisphaeraceae bacterium]|nr:MAG: DUF86 domain-containing protein [Phycisphaeraceae bacterium]
MLDAGVDACTFLEGKVLDDLEKDRALALAVIKSIEIVGEAASRVTEATREQIPAIPWADVVAMRHRLVHGYYDINLRTVWDTVNDDLPPLIEAIRSMIV